MTCEGKRLRLKSVIDTLILLASLLSLFVISVFFSNKLSDYVKTGLTLACEKIIPVVFPTLILTDLAVHFSKGSRHTAASRLLSKILGVRCGCADAFTLGLICGFPTGAKLSYDAYKNGIIDKQECERMIALANNPSAPFVLGIIGCSFMSDIRIGVTLYISMVSGAIILSLLTRKNNYNLHFTDNICEQSYSFIDSVKRAAQISTNVIAFVSTFYILSRFLISFLGDGLITAAILPLIEITASADYISDLCIFDKFQKLVLLSFSTGFSGLSAIVQSISVIPKSERISLKKILLYKLIQGTLSALITALIFILFLN